MKERAYVEIHELLVFRFYSATLNMAKKGQING